jgi:3-methylfumaryl-CoA hydratase
VTTPMCAAAEQWKPRLITSVETLDPAPVAALSALLDSGAHEPAVEEVLPPLWHWVALPRWPVSSVLALDGHPRRGDFLPPIDLPRRMFAGGKLRLYGDLRVGAQVVRESIVASVEEKEGRSGRLAVVQVTTLLRERHGGDVLVEERQDLVYREAQPAREPGQFPDPAGVASMAPVGTPLVRENDRWQFVTDPTLLMRFSAATANAHRIHYDWPYATRVEGYPGLVVQGPLSTLVLAEVLRLEQPGRVLRLRHRNTAPLFCGAPAHVTVDLPSTDLAEITLMGSDGNPVASLSADLGTPSVA